MPWQRFRPTRARDRNRPRCRSRRGRPRVPPERAHGSGADGDREVEIPAERDPAQGSHGRPAAARLLGGDHGHGLDLGRPRDRCRRKRSAQQVRRGDVRPKPPADGRDRVVDGRQRHQLGVCRYLDAARLAHAAEVVPRHVHDHGQLGPVLLALQQLADKGPVLTGIGTTRSGALDGTGLDLAVLHGQKDLGRDREHCLSRPKVPPSEVNKRAPLGRARLAQPEVQGPDVLRREPGLQAAAKVHLEDFPARDALHDPRHRRLEVAPVGIADDTVLHEPARGDLQVSSLPGSGQDALRFDRWMGSPGVRRLQRPTPAVPVKDGVVETQMEIGKPKVVRWGRRERLDLTSQLISKIARQRAPGSHSLPGREGRVQQVEPARLEADPSVLSDSVRSDDHRLPVADGEDGERPAEDPVPRLPAVQPREALPPPQLLSYLERRRLRLSPGAKRSLRAAGMGARSGHGLPQPLDQPLPTLPGETVGPHRQGCRPRIA